MKTPSYFPPDAVYRYGLCVGKNPDWFEVGETRLIHGAKRPSKATLKHAANMKVKCQQCPVYGGCRAWVYEILESGGDADPFIGTIIGGTDSEDRRVYLRDRRQGRVA